MTVRKGEHVIPDSIGGAVCLKSVCNACNRDFSSLDKELTSMSPLATLVQQELGTRGEKTWGYDYGLDIALEARPLPRFSGPPIWPQLLLLGEKPVFMFDYADASRIGVPDFARAFWWCLGAALQSLYRSLCEGEKRPYWIWEKILEAPRRGRFPPRIYTEHTLDEFRQAMSFKCRYIEGEDRNRIIYHARRWRPSDRYELKSALGAPDLNTLYRYRWEFVLRALVKIAINHLVYIEGPERVNLGPFAGAVGYVQGNGRLRLMPESNGFVVNSDIQFLNCPQDCHCSRLQHDGRSWTCNIAFFGGRLGATVSFPGPAIGDCVRMEAIWPYKGNNRRPQIHKSSIMIPDPPMRIEWRRMPLLIPSIPQR